MRIRSPFSPVVRSPPAPTAPRPAVGTAPTRPTSLAPAASAQGVVTAPPGVARRGETESVVLNGKVVTLGGMSLFKVHSEVTTYDPQSGQWGSLPSLPAPLHHFGAVSDGTGRIFATGGASRFFPWEPRTSLYVYDARANAWREGPPMPEARLGHDAIWHQGKIYVVGGEGKGDASRVLIFDPATNSWSKGASMPTPRHHVSAFVHKDKIYVAGGQAHGNVVRTVEVYDPRTNAWSRAPDLPAYMSGANTVSVGGRIYGFGGEGPRWPAIPWLSWKVNPDIYTLDPATDTWRTVGTMRLPRHGMGAVPIGDRAYLGFGATAARGFPFTETAAIEWFNPGPN